MSTGNMLDEIEYVAIGMSSRLLAVKISLIARFMGPTYPSESCRSQVGPMLATWILLSELLSTLELLCGGTCSLDVFTCVPLGMQRAHNFTIDQIYSVIYIQINCQPHCGEYIWPWFLIWLMGVLTPVKLRGQCLWISHTVAASCTGGKECYTY